MPATKFSPTYPPDGGFCACCSSFLRAFACERVNLTGPSMLRIIRRMTVSPHSNRPSPTDSEPWTAREWV
ncbi:hypothetical protein KCP75_10705 [Salmonella enterica subsp. enterica]|nr:hypothetical protein KCP75_10705 [Salmonella enterica subsp. enterica]